MSLVVAAGGTQLVRAGGRQVETGGRNAEPEWPGEAICAGLEAGKPVPLPGQQVTGDRHLLAWAL